MVAEEGGHGLRTSSVSLRLGVTFGDLPPLVASLSPGITEVDHRLVEQRRLASAESTLLEAVDAAHQARPLDRGTPLQPLRSRLGLGAELAEWVIRAAVERGAIGITDGLVARAGWTPRYSDEDRTALAAIEAMLGRAGREAPSLAEIALVAGPRTPALIRLLERERRVVQVGEQRFLTPAAWGEALRILREGTRVARAYAAGEIREIFGVSRKFSIPLMEGCDRAGVSTRVGDGRVFHWDQKNAVIAAFLDSSGGDP
jgi:selenocysteine-specific elongation factor